MEALYIKYDLEVGVFYQMFQIHISILTLIYHKLRLIVVLREGDSDFDCTDGAYAHVT